MSRTYGSTFSVSDSGDYIYNLKLKTIMCYLECNPNQYVTLEYGNHTYIKITSAELLYQPLTSMYNYVKIDDAILLEYLTIENALQTYALQSTYVSIVDASANYLARTGESVTSDAEITTFNQLIVNEIFKVQNIYILGNGSSNGIGITNNSPLIGSGTVVIGNNISNTNIVDSVIIGSNATGSNTSVIIGYNAETNENSVAIGATSLAIGSNSVAIGANSSAIWNNSVAIGNGSTATEENQIMLGTIEQTVYCPGQLSLSSNITLNSQTISGPGQLGYTISATINYFNDTLINTTSFATFNLPLGVWYITGSVNLDTTGTSSYILLTYGLDVDGSKYGYMLSPSSNTVGFNYNNIITNTLSTQSYNLMLTNIDTSSSDTFTANVASYLIATRIA